MKTTIKLSGLMLLGIIVAAAFVAGCTPKKSETANQRFAPEAAQPQTPTERETTTVQTETVPLNSSSSRYLFEQNFAHNNITEITGGDSFSGEYVTYKYLPTDGDKANIENIQLFENAGPNRNVSKGDLVSDEPYYETRPVPSACSDLRINNDNTISNTGTPPKYYERCRKIERPC